MPVQLRAQAISRVASAGEPQSAALITGLDDGALASMCESIQEQHPDSVCRVAARLHPRGRVIAGHEAAVTQVRTLRRW